MALEGSVRELGPRGCALLSISSVFVLPKVSGVQRDSRSLRDQEKAADVWLVFGKEQPMEIEKGEKSGFGI